MSPTATGTMAPTGRPAAGSGNRPGDTDRNHPAARSRRRFGLLMTSPAIVILAALMVIPTVITVVYSVFRPPASGRHLGPFVGLSNYGTVLSSEVFWKSALTTLLFSIGFVVGSTVLGLAIAVLLNQRFVGRGLCRTLLIIPWAMPWLVLGILWRWFADGDVGGLNVLLTGIGLQDGQRDYLADPTSALILVTVASIWRQASFAGILFLAGLQTMPTDMAEAAQLDGAGVWQRFRYLTLPWLRPVTATVTVLNVIYAFLSFDVIFAMTQGGPGDATQVLSIVVYRQLFVVTNIGLGSALAVVLAVLALLGGLLTVRLVARSDNGAVTR
ncbi:carbohydrate ABC transporter permease [Nakamurella aerolata]